MAILESDIQQEDLIRGLPLFLGGFAIQAAPPPQVVRYEYISNVSGNLVTVDIDEIDLSTLEDLDQLTIRRRLNVYRNGQKIIYEHAMGFTIDFTDNKIELEYEPDSEDIEVYLHP
jgi:hypothetical protein